MRRSAWRLAFALCMAFLPSMGLADMQSNDVNQAAAPERPREFVDTTLRPSLGRTIMVKAGEDFQEALDEAHLGDLIVLEAGATFQGPFELPKKMTGTGWVTIRSSALDRLPASGTRVQPVHAAMMPKLTASHGSVVKADKGAHHYRFIGVEIVPEDNTFLYELVILGTNRERSVEELPHHIIVDRSYVHGDRKKGARRGLAMNGRHLAVIDSYFSDFKEVGQDSQAVSGWGGSGPFKILNNYLEGAAENILFGGGDPSIQGLIPSDIEVRHNHAVKPLAWKPGEPNYDGRPWQVKILFELKNARRVLVDGNIFENNWQTPGYGFAVVFTVRNQDGSAPWVVVEDVTFTNNIVRHSSSGVNVLGFDDIHPPSEQTKRLLIKNNIFEDIGGPRWGGKGRLFQLFSGTKDVSIEHNTAIHTGDIVMAVGTPHEGFMYRYNIAPHNELGITGANAGIGAPALQIFFPGAVVAHNLIIGGEDRRYPPTNIFPDTLKAVSFVNLEEGDYRLASSSRYKSGETGVDPGVHVEALCAALGTANRSDPICKTSLLAGGER